MSKSMESWSVDDVVKAFDKEFGGLSTEMKSALETNAIDGPFLLTLTDDDLEKELGCTKLQVKKIRRMIEQSQRLMSVGSSNNPPPGQTATPDIPEPLPSQPPPPGGAYGQPMPMYPAGAYGQPPSGYPSGGMGAPLYSAHAPAYGGVPSSPFSQGTPQQPVPQNYGGQGSGMPPPMYYAPPNYNQMGPYDQYEQQQQRQVCACSIM